VLTGAEIAALASIPSVPQNMTAIAVGGRLVHSVTGIP